jgi:hypothetical protein
MKKHPVTTNLPLELYTLAKNKKIAFNEALEMGIRQKLSLNDEKQLLIKELELHNKHIDSIMVRLSDIDKMEVYVEEFTIDKVLKIVQNLIDNDRPIIYSSIEYWAAELNLNPEEVQTSIKESFPDVDILHMKEDKIVIDGIMGG